MCMKRSVSLKVSSGDAIATNRLVIPERNAISRQVGKVIGLVRRNSLRPLRSYQTWERDAYYGSRDARGIRDKTRLHVGAFPSNLVCVYCKLVVIESCLTVIGSTPASVILATQHRR
jgi:hypothetical protein